MREGWKKVRLNEFVWFQRGFDLPKSKFKEGDVPVYGSTSVLGYHDEVKVKAPGIITGRSGTLGVMQYAQEDFWPHNTTLWVKDFKGNDQRFAYYLLQCLDFSLFNSGGAVPTLNRNVLNSFVIDLPPLNTQRKIASILSAYDDLIENNLRRIALLEEQAQQTYEEWFVRFKFPGHEQAAIDAMSGLPEGWEKVKIEDVIEVGRGSSPRPIANQEYFVNGDIPWLKIADATASHIYIYETKQYVNDYGASFSRKLPKGSIVVAASGTLGFPMILGVEACIHDGWLYFKGIDDKLKEYFYFSFIGLRSYFESISYGAAIQNINTEIVRQSPFIVPSEDVTVKFKVIASKIFKSISNLQIQNQLLKEARDILLPRLMSGMIDPWASAGQVGERLDNELAMAAEPEGEYNSKKQ